MLKAAAETNGMYDISKKHPVFTYWTTSYLANQSVCSKQFGNFNNS